VTKNATNIALSGLCVLSTAVTYSLVPVRDDNPQHQDLSSYHRQGGQQLVEKFLWQPCISRSEVNGTRSE